MKLGREPTIAVVRCGRLSQQHHLSTLLTFFVRKGFQVYLYALQCPSVEVEEFQRQYPQISVEELGMWPDKGLLRFFYGGRALRSCLKRKKIDVVYVIDSWTLRYFAVACILSWKIWRNGFIYHSFDMLAPGVAGWYERALERVIARAAIRTVVTDGARAALMKAFYGLEEPPLGVAVRLLSDFEPPDQTAVDKAREDLLPKGCQYLVISPTRLSSERVAKEIIIAASLLPERYALVTYAGKQEFTQECLELARKHGLGARYIVLPECSHVEVLQACAASDVALVFHDDRGSLGNYFCHPSRLAYCAALGVPVVANAVPSIESVVYRYNLGVCASIWDSEEIAAEIQHTCEAENGRPGTQERIRTAFAKHLTFEKQGEELIEVIRSSLRDSRTKKGE